MSEAEASRFIAATQNDKELSNELEKLKDDPQKLIQAIKSRGYDVTPEEIREAVLENIAPRVSESELQTIAAGLNLSNKEKVMLGAGGAAAAVAEAEGAELDVRVQRDRGCVHVRASEQQGGTQAAGEGTQDRGDGQVHGMNSA